MPWGPELPPENPHKLHTKNTPNHQSAAKIFSLPLPCLVTTTGHRDNTCPVATSLVCSYLRLFRAPAPQFPTFSLLNFMTAGAGGNGAGNVIGMLASDQEAGGRGWKAEGSPGWGVIQAPAGTRCLWLDVSWQEQEEGRRSFVSTLLCTVLPVLHCPDTRTHHCCGGSRAIPRAALIPGPFSLSGLQNSMLCFSVAPNTCPKSRNQHNTALPTL